MNWTELLKTEAKAAYATTAKLMDRVDPERLGWKPESGCNWMNVGQLLKHLSNACGAGCRGFVCGDWGLPAGKTLQDLPPEEMMPTAERLPTIGSVDEAKRLLMQDEQLALQMIDQAGEHALSNQEVEAPWNPGLRMVLGRHLLQMIQHLDRHKSQLFFYLKLQGSSVGTVDLWGQ